MRADELTGEARKLFESWRALGYTEGQALEEVERSGIVAEEQLSTMFESLGMSPDAARIAAQGREGGAALHPFDETVRTFQRMGLSAEAARAAAIGRGGTEAEVRQHMAEAARENLAACAPQDEAGQVKAAFDEAVKAASRFYGYSLTEATAWIQRKVDEELASRPLAERAAELRIYARVFNSYEPVKTLGGK